MDVPHHIIADRTSVLPIGFWKLTPIAPRRTEVLFSHDDSKICQISSQEQSWLYGKAACVPVWWGQINIERTIIFIWKYHITFFNSIDPLHDQWHASIVEYNHVIFPACHVCKSKYDTVHFSFFHAQLYFEAKRNLFFPWSPPWTMWMKSISNGLRSLPLITPCSTWRNS